MAQGFNNVPPMEQQLLDNLVGGNIGGILSTRPQAKYVSGARTILRVNGKIVGFAFGVGWNITTLFKELYVIDNPLAEELTPQRIRVDGHINALHIPGLSAGAQVWQADPLSFLFHQYLTIEVRDSVTSQLLFYAPKAVITSRREEIRVDNLAHVSLSFMAIGYRDERDPTIPQYVDTLSQPKENITNLGDQALHDRQVIDSSSSKEAGTSLSDVVSSVGEAISSIF